MPNHTIEEGTMEASIIKIREEAIRDLIKGTTAEVVIIIKAEVAQMWLRFLNTRPVSR